MDKQGWVKMYRKSLDSSVWKSPTIWMVWSWCLMKANHEENKFPFNGEDITVKKGEFISGTQQAILEIPCLTTQKWRTAISYLKSTGRITVKSNNKFSVISIYKWNDYQTDNSLANKPITNQQQTNNKPITTNNNDKNEKNDKNNMLVEKITKWAYERARVIPSCSRDSFSRSVFKNMERAGADKVYKLFEKSENAIQFLMEIKHL